MKKACLFSILLVLIACNRDNGNGGGGPAPAAPTGVEAAGQWPVPPPVDDTNRMSMKIDGTRMHLFRGATLVADFDGATVVAQSQRFMILEQNHKLLVYHFLQGKIGDFERNCEAQLSDVFTVLQCPADGNNFFIRIATADGTWVPQIDLKEKTHLIVSNTFVGFFGEKIAQVYNVKSGLTDGCNDETCQIQVSNGFALIKKPKEAYANLWDKTGKLITNFPPEVQVTMTPSLAILHAKKHVEIYHMDKGQILATDDGAQVKVDSDFATITDSKGDSRLFGPQGEEKK